MNEKYKEAFKENLNAFCKNLDKNYQKEKYCLFYPMIGEKYGEGTKILFYGQAVKGWGEKKEYAFKTSDILNEQKAFDIVQKAIEESKPYENQTDPFQFINDKWIEHGIFRSFFWNVVYKLSNKINSRSPSVNEWTQNIVWSNLMKIAPYDQANPNNDEWKAQLEISKELFNLELKILKPDLVICLTNWEWAKDFVNENNFKLVENQYVTHVSKSDKPKIMITKRGLGGSNNQCVNEIIKELN